MIKQWNNNMFISHMFVRYIFVGFINTLFGYSLFGILIFFGFHYSIAVFFSTVLGVVFNFKTIGKYVFNKVGWSEFVRFIFVYALIYVTNLLFIGFFNSYWDNMYISGALCLIPATLISFSLHKLFVFGEKG